MFKLRYVLLLLILFSYFISGQWVRQSIPNELGILLSVDFKNELNGIAGGWKFTSFYNGGNIVYTTNGGNNWIISQTPDTLRSAVTIQFTGNNTGYCTGAYNISVGNYSTNYFSLRTNPLLLDRMLTNRISNSEDPEYKAYFLMSTNNGMNWFPLNTIPDSIYFLLGLYFTNSNTGYVSGDRNYGTFDATGTILKTTNGGFNWIEQFIPDSTGDIRNFFFLNENTGYGSAYYKTFDSTNLYNGLILKTTNGGINWKSFRFPETNNFSDIVMADMNTGFVCGTSTNAVSGIVYKTTDTGNNWYPVNFNLPYFFPLSIEYIDSILIVSGQITLFTNDSYSFKPFLSRSTDLGNTWENYIFDDTSSLINDASLLSNERWYFSGGDITNSAFVYYTNIGGAIGIGNKGVSVSDYIILHQNYPNPFNPETNISFSLSYKTKVELKIYNIYGQLVTKLINKALSSGLYNFKWNGADYASGIYIVRMETPEASLSRKMILIK